MVTYFHIWYLKVSLHKTEKPIRLAKVQDFDNVICLVNAVGNEQLHVLLVRKQNVSCDIINGGGFGTIQKNYLYMSPFISRYLSLKNTDKQTHKKA